MNVSVRSNINELTFCVFGRSVHPELFRIQKQEEVAVPLRNNNYRLLLKLCEEGHVIELRDAQRTLAFEVVGGRDELLPTFGRVIDRRIRGHRHLEADFGEVQYRAAYQVERLPAETFAIYHEELERDATRATIGCRLAIPLEDSEVVRPPVSLIQFERCGNTLGLHAFHSFPQELAVVKTQTLLEFETD